MGVSAVLAHFLEAIFHRHLAASSYKLSSAVCLKVYNKIRLIFDGLLEILKI